MAQFFTIQTSHYFHLSRTAVLQIRKSLRCVNTTTLAATVIAPLMLRLCDLTNVLEMAVLLFKTTTWHFEAHLPGLEPFTDIMLRNYVNLALRTP